MPINESLAQETWDRYRYSRDHGHLDFVKKANKCDNFYLGQQWDPVTKVKLDNQRRPALTINKTLATISNIQGDQIQVRAEASFKPIHVSGEDISNTLAVLFKQVTGLQKLTWKESSQFDDGVITSRGFLDVRLSFENNIQGEIEINVLNPRNVVIDPDAEEYDPDTWKDVVETKWVSPNDIELLYNKEDADYLRSNNADAFLNDIDSSMTTQDRFGGGSGRLYGTPVQGGRDLIRDIRLLSRQYKKLTRRKFFVDRRTGDQRLIPDGWAREKIGRVLELYDLGVIERVVERIRWTTTAGPCVLHDGWSPYKHFTQVPYFPYFRRGRTMGVVENLIDPQELFNKVRSQELHIVNTTANSGWKVKAGALAGGMTVEELEQRGAETGVVIEVNDMDGLEKFTPNQIPTGLDRISYKAEQDIKTISNVDDNALGQDREDVAAKAIKAKRQRGAVNQLKIMDNFNYSRQLLARNVLDIFQEYYTEPRVYRVVYGNPLAQAGDPKNEFIELNKFDEASGRIINDLTIGTYEVVITTQPASDTIEESEFDQAMAMREAGIAIPDHVIIAHSLLRNKRELIENMREQADSPEAQQQRALVAAASTAEVEKTRAETDKIKADAMSKLATAQEKAGNMAAGPDKAGADSGGQLINQVMQNHHEAAQQAAQQAHELQVQREQQGHETRQALLEHQQATAEAEQSAEHTAEQQKAQSEAAVKLAKAKPKPAAKPAAKSKGKAK